MCSVTALPIYPTWCLTKTWIVLKLALRRETWADVYVSFKQQCLYLPKSSFCKGSLLGKSTVCFNKVEDILQQLILSTIPVQQQRYNFFMSLQHRRKTLDKLFVANKRLGKKRENWLSFGVGGIAYSRFSAKLPWCFVIKCFFVESCDARPKKFVVIPGENFCIKSKWKAPLRSLISAQL